MPRIVNLSSLHRLLPLSCGLDAFAELCRAYSRGCFSCCPSFFARLSNKAWVAWKYSQNINTVINPYKLGDLTTEEFLNRMLAIFSFLDDDNLNYPHAVVDELWKDKNIFISLRKIGAKTELSNRLIALALLEKAWNAIIDFEEADLIKFEWLTREKEPTYLISNSNELNVNKLLNLLRKHFPDIRWKEAVDISAKKDDEPIEIAPNIYLYLSYRVGAYKTDADNKEAQNSTPCLLRTLITRLRCDPSQIHVISQYGKDLEEAARLVPINNVHLAKDYYPMSIKTLRQIV